MIFREGTYSNTHFARTGELNLNGVKVKTPVFMPVGTRGTVRAISSADIRELGYNLILGNTYHLYLRPGADVLSSFGGLKKFMSYDGAILTDSGGFQVFSLQGLFKFFEGGVHFSSHIDGSKHTFTPESVIDIQRAIGSDIMMVLDDCAPYGSDRKRLLEALERTDAWAKRSILHWEKDKANQHLFGIVQGGVDIELRKQSLGSISALPFSGIALGGLSVGEPREEFVKVMEALAPFLDTSRPRYLMGVGTVVDILEAVKNGVDMFDCVLPTRNARNGQVFTSKGKVNLRNKAHEYSDKPIDEECSCRVCKNYSIGYIRHLHKVKEILALSLSTLHNLYFMKQFMEKIGEAIEGQYFEEFYNSWKKLYNS